MNRIRLIFFLLIIPQILFCQNSLSGSLTDIETHKPIEYATIYIDGSAKGTISDSKGHYHLENLRFPCKVVISHINYQTFIAEFNYTKEQELILNQELSPRKIELNEVVVLDKNKRKENLEYFQKTFLGDNKWGEYAFIKNDSVLFFTPKNRTDLDRNYMQHPEFPDSFRAEALAPIIIELPLLGYEMHVNLEKFTVNYIDNSDQYQTQCIGYTYFIPQTITSSFKRKRIEKHRKEVYYNSRLHLYRSINNNSLKANGYVLSNRSGYDIYKKHHIYKPIKLDSLIVRNEYGTSIIGLKNQSLYLLYYSNLKAEPIDLNIKKPLYRPVISSLLITKDTCFISGSGRNPDQSIIFGPAIGDKKLGTWLPDDYYPNAQIKDEP